MTVQVDETPMVHVPVIFRIGVQFPAQRKRGVHDFVDLLPARERQSDRHLRKPVRIDDFPVRQRMEEILPDQHDLQMVADDDGRRSFVFRELRVELESESGKLI